jgi:acetyl esterase/lipase
VSKLVILTKNGKPELKRSASTITASSLSGLAIVCSIAFGAATLASGTSGAAEPPRVDEDGTTHLPAFSLPESSFLSDDTRGELKHARDRGKEDVASENTCPPILSANAIQAPAIRKCQADVYYRSASYRRLHDLFHVSMTPREIGGVYTEVFTPAEGISPKNRNRVLINVHGGGFVQGSRTLSQIESVPIASLGKIKVISVDYRQGPEFHFPAASEDVTAVYLELLKTYKPKNIGIYGCSAGGLLTAEAVAWFQKEKLPLPGAIGMLCEGAGYWIEGDSGYVQETLYGSLKLEDNPYFKNTNPSDPLAFPVRSTSLMAKFPPSLLIAGTRDFALSSVVHTHSVLISQGVEAELHVWEGLHHAFFFDPDLSESHEVYAVTVKFFETHLGKE